jgi:uncharacterized phage-associated protein
MDRSVAIANEFLKMPGGRALTQMQLQKLVYLAHGWNLALNGEPLVTEPPEAWSYGPVFRDLYDHTKYFGSAPVGRAITPDDDEAARFFTRSKSGRPAYQANLTPHEKAVIERVWKRYGSMDGSKLSSLTHKPGTPWFVTYRQGKGKSDTIPNSLIREHYEQLAQRAREVAAPTV